MKRKLSIAALVALPLVLMSCRTPPPITTASRVDLPRFMGDWYVMANIPTFIERDAWNALEKYELREDGAIATTFSFNRGSADGPRKVYHPLGFVREDTGSAIWGMRFIWPFKAEYIVVFVDEAHTETVIGRRKRDYVWIMTRSPDHPEARVNALIDLAVEEGYDRAKIQRVPHAPQ
jgi:apolipoprotein D and lipocalin family protein